MNDIEEKSLYSKIVRFEDLVIWQESMKLAKDIFILFKENKNFYLRDQVNRSALSISSNIAEGFERQTNKEYIQFLYIAKGSCAELRTQIHFAVSVNEIEKEKAEILIEKSIKISSMLYKLIQTRYEKFNKS